MMNKPGIALVKASIATHYGAFLDGLLIDNAEDAPAGLAVARAATSMRDDADKARAAQVALDIDTADDIAAAGAALPLGRWCSAPLCA
ncbi:hypothetical protein GGR44_002371 [Sphingobium fontiphilum]|uniref:Uncharacterized protein n=1 Tax=Sphingobium fontiphilum TaxID=944425 RepID=A0A7W6DG77_9SPHN|nr:hypothetical protein [Sphingobium fontiphilum]MBB3982705.1 hypothetical protein [Sphingobium fontiphilum]